MDSYLFTIYYTIFCLDVLYLMLLAYLSSLYLIPILFCLSLLPLRYRNPSETYGVLCSICNVEGLCFVVGKVKGGGGRVVCLFALIHS